MVHFSAFAYNGRVYYNDFNAFHVQLPQCNKLLRITMGRQYFVDSLRTVGTKGQLNSEWIYEVIVCPKTPTKNYRDFCPGSLLEIGQTSQ